MTMPLPAALQNSHENGERVFLSFVANPRIARLCRISDAVSSSAQSSKPGPFLGLRGCLEVELDKDAEQLIDELADV
jgi:hypothetical protein